MKKKLFSISFVLATSLFGINIGFAQGGPMPGYGPSTGGPCLGMMCADGNYHEPSWKTIFTQTEKAVTKEGVEILVSRFPQYFNRIATEKIQNATIQISTAIFVGKHSCVANDPLLKIEFLAQQEICYKNEGPGSPEICSMKTFSPPPFDPCRHI